MFDIDFYMKFAKLADVTPASLERIRSDRPVIFNIETTNACNMSCKMCPRPSLMTRPISTMDIQLFKRIVGQIEPHEPGLISEWISHCVEHYGVDPFEVSENNFFLYVISQAIILHGYGDPLLDKDIAKRVEMLTDKKIPSYFSCNPVNVNNGRVKDCIHAGLGYIKYSVESTDDATFKSVRGERSDFNKSLDNIMDTLAIANKTQIVVTMLDLNRNNQVDDFEKLREMFKGTNAYVYLKSQDQQWFDGSMQQNKSIHWSEPCKFPWSSMTINADGRVVSCVEDYNGEMVLGDAKLQTLKAIWHGPLYDQFRLTHFTMDKGIKCVKRCDMKLMGEHGKHN
jgi:MoaA/NifB/PqqE/SkfB family radical SAM enzyme